MRQRWFALLLVLTLTAGCESEPPTGSPTLEEVPTLPAVETPTLAIPLDSTITLPAFTQTPIAEGDATAIPAAEIPPLVDPSHAALPAGALMRQGIGVVLDSDLSPDGSQVA